LEREKEAANAEAQEAAAKMAEVLNDMKQRDAAIAEVQKKVR
jgi:hypothetical protein